MYENIGRKIKGLSKFIAYVGISFSFLIGLIMMMQGCDTYHGGDELIMTGLLVMVVGSLSSWISSWFAYGFGELIEKVTIMAEGKTIKSSEKVEKGESPYTSQLNTLKKWRDSDLISEEEYKDKVNELIERISKGE